MKKTMLYPVITVVLALLEIFFAVLLILSLLPPQNPLGLEMKEYVSVSPSLIGNGEYALQITGEIANKGEKSVNLDAFEITVAKENEQKTLTVDAKITMEPRTGYFISYDDIAPVGYDRVLSVRAITAQGDTDVANAPAGIFTLSSLLGALACIITAVFLIHFAKQCYYLKQEQAL